METLDQQANTGEKAPRDSARAQGGNADPQQQYGERFEKLPTNLQAKLRELVNKAQEREQFARRREIERVQKNRLFELGIQHTVWNEDLGVYQVGQQGGGLQQDDAGDEGALYQRDIQNYLGYEKSFRSTFCQPSPTLRFEPDEAKEGIDITAAQEAEKMKRIIEKYNDPKKLQDDVGRYLWTDGFVIARSRMVYDGQRFGYEEDDDEAGAAQDSESVQPDVPGAPADAAREPESVGEAVGDTDSSGSGQEARADNRTAKGREVIDMYGALETKRPLSIRDPHRWPYLIISTEDDIAMAKSEYSDIEDKIEAGAKPHGAEGRARLARIITSQGSSWESSGAGATAIHLVTVDRCWFRPSWFTELGGKDDKDRAELERIFQDGCHCVFIGETFCEARNESMDDHLKSMTTLRGNGQAIPGLGNALLDPCEAFDDMFNMSEEAFKFCIPSKIFRNKVLDLEAINEQPSQYGAYIEANPDPQPEKPFADNFFEETPVQPPEMMAEMMVNTQGPLCQFLSGQLAPLMGQSDEHNETAKGITILRDQALGLMGLIWMPFTTFYGEVMLDAVRIAAKERDQEKPLSANVDIPGKKGKQELLEVDIGKLQGNFHCSPIVDANFPESWSAKSNRFFQIMSVAQANPVLTQLMNHPDNRALAKDMLGLEDFVDPKADSRDKQIQEIARLSKEAPVPPSQEALDEAVQAETQKFQAAQALEAAGQSMGVPVPPAQPPDPEQLLAQLTQQLTTSSVEIDPECDDHLTEAEECLRWINSPIGQRMKNSPDDNDRNGFINVRLHYLEHKAQAAKMAAAAAPPPPVPAQHGPGPGAPKAAPAPQVGAQPQTGAIQ